MKKKIQLNTTTHKSIQVMKSSTQYIILGILVSLPFVAGLIAIIVHAVYAQKDHEKNQCPIAIKDCVNGFGKKLTGILVVVIAIFVFQVGSFIISKNVPKTLRS